MTAWFGESSTYIFARLTKSFDDIRSAVQRLGRFTRRNEHGDRDVAPCAVAHLLRPEMLGAFATQVAMTPWGLRPSVAALRRPAHAGHEDYG